jgi:hypothetical protein
MAKPVILTVDDDPKVLQAVARDLRRNTALVFELFEQIQDNARSRQCSS